MAKSHALIWCCLLGLALLVACRPESTGLPTLTPTLTAATPTTTPTMPAATPTPVTYVVQPGDSLSVIAARYDVPVEALAQANGIADPNVIKVGQVLVIPGPTPIPTATVPPTPTATPDIPPQLEIVDVIGRGAPSAETVVIVNRGRGLSLNTWSLRDAQGNAFIFPDLYVAPGAEIRVHTGVGENTPQHLYWNRDTPVWEESGDMAVLADERGVMHAAKSLE
jgi:LysM repeat protein